MKTRLLEVIHPSIGKILIGVALFTITLFVGKSGGVGFPLKFFALGFPFLGSGFFKPFYLITDIFIWYLAACSVFYLFKRK